VLPAHPALLRAINMEQASRLISSIGNVPEFFQQQYDKDQPKSAESFLSPDELLHLQADLRTLHAKISLTDEDIAHVVRMATVKTLSNGAVIMREGDTSQFLIWILKGQVSVHSHAKGHLCTIDSGFVGHHSHIYNKQRSATIIASGGVVVYVQLSLPHNGVVYVWQLRPLAYFDFMVRFDDTKELQSVELDAMMRASTAIAASLEKEAREVSLNLQSSEIASEGAHQASHEELQVDLLWGTEIFPLSHFAVSNNFFAAFPSRSPAHDNVFARFSRATCLCPAISSLASSRPLANLHMTAVLMRVQSWFYLLCRCN
jgi:hypothetical protein